MDCARSDSGCCRRRDRHPGGFAGYAHRNYTSLPVGPYPLVTLRAAACTTPTAAARSIASTRCGSRWTATSARTTANASGCQADLFTFVEQTVSSGSKGNTAVAGTDASPRKATSRSASTMSPRATPPTSPSSPASTRSTTISPAGDGRHLRQPDDVRLCRRALLQRRARQSGDPEPRAGSRLETLLCR